MFPGKFSREQRFQIDKPRESSGEYPTAEQAADYLKSMWIHSGNGFASVKSQGCLCREVVKISVSAERRSTNGHEGGNFDKRPVLALEFFIPEGRYRIRAPLTPPSLN